VNSITQSNSEGVARKRAILLVLGLLGICNFGSAGATVEVKMQDYYYQPQFVSINIGDTILWKNYEGEHTASSDTGLFDSDVTEFYDEYPFTFTEAGNYPFHCSLHGSPGDGMFGSIMVSEASANAAPATPVNQSPANNAANQPVALQLRASAFSDPDGIDFHADSEWILRYASNNAVAVDSGEVGGANLLTYSPANLLEGTTYDWQVRYKDGRGAWSEYSGATRFTTLVSFNQQGIGLKASYNNTADFAAPLVVMTNALVDFSWLKSRPSRLITADDFAVRWEGSLLPQFTAKYAIQFQYHGRARVWVNDKLLIDEWTGCSFSQTRRGLISLVAGQLVSVRVEYVADPAEAQAILRWSCPALPMEVIPTARLFPNAP
jgi:plastocyanin